MMFELAETYDEMMNLKLIRANTQVDTQSLDKHSIKKINHLCSSATKWASICDSGVMTLRLLHIFCLTAVAFVLQILPDVPGLSALSGWKVSREAGGGCAQAGAGGALQNGPTLQQANLPPALCSAGKPQQVSGQLHVRRSHRSMQLLWIDEDYFQKKIEAAMSRCLSVKSTDPHFHPAAVSGV